MCISISSVCYTSFGHFHCSVLRSIPPYVSFVILIAVIVILVIVIFVSFCLFVSFLFFRRFLPSVCLSVGFSISAPLRAHISHHIHSRFVPASNLSKIGTLRASGHLERTSGSRLRASEHRKRTKGTKNTHYNLHPGLVPTSTSPTKHCVRTARLEHKRIMFPSQFQVSPICVR